jgi:hypothetical protein
VSPKPAVILAREHLDRALPEVTAENYTEAVTWLFYALEAAVQAVADRKGVTLSHRHWKKADAARDLHAQGEFDADYSGTLRMLNEARKEAVYAGDEPDLGGSSLEDLAADVESAVTCAERS